MPAKGYKKKKTDTHSCRIEIRCTEQEFLTIGKRADACGLTVSEFLRKLAGWHAAEKSVEEAPKARLGRVDEARVVKLMALVNELNRNGTNLNQLARQANTGMVPVSRKELDETLNRVNGLVSDVRKIIDPFLR